MRIISIVGARPQFVKVAVICRAIAQWNGPAMEHRIIHTGQHYDSAMSDVFFEELEIPRPDFNLGVGSGPHGEQTGEMIKRIEPILHSEAPDWVLLYGDTNSTLAGAVVSSKMGLPTAHIEAGLRSFDRRMPEELNRVATDHLSDLLLCPTETAIENLRREGLEARSAQTGDVMYDAALFYHRRAEQREATGAISLPPIARTDAPFALATVHRAENTDAPEKLAAILEALDALARDVCPVLLPLHPRTLKAIEAAHLSAGRIEILPPASFFQMLLLEARASLIMTDSGGVQKEAYFANRPCVTLRNETEWVETLENRCNVLAGSDPARIKAAAAGAATAGPWRQLYGDGDAGTRILEVLSSQRAGGPLEQGREAAR